MKSNMKVELELTMMIFHKSVCQGKNKILFSCYSHCTSDKLHLYLGSP